MSSTIEQLTRTHPQRFGLDCDFTDLKDLIDNDIFAFDAVNTGTFAAAAGNGGGAVLSGAATTDDSGGNLQASGCVHNLVAGKRIRAGVTATMSEATQSDLYFGLLTIDTSIIASQTSLYGVYFRKDDGDANIDCAYAINGTVTTVATAAATADTSEHTYEVRITPSFGSATTTLLEWFIDGLLVASATITTLLATNDLLWSLAFQSGVNTGTISITLKRAWTDQEY